MNDQHIDPALREQAVKVANEFARAYNKKHKLSIPLPVQVEFGLEFVSLRSAKMAGQALRAELKIALNYTMFADNVSTFFNVVIPHEVAHLAQYTSPVVKRVPNAAAGHGWLWVEMMETMSQKPLQFHTMDSTKSIAAYKANQKRLKDAKALKAKNKKDEHHDPILLIPLNRAVPHSH